MKDCYHFYLDCFSTQKMLVSAEILPDLTQSKVTLEPDNGTTCIHLSHPYHTPAMILQMLSH